MSIDIDTTQVRKSKNFPLHRTLSGFIRDPLAQIERMSMEANGELLRVDLGVFRPYVVTHPDHVQQVLRDKSDDYARAGTFWRPLNVLFGGGILSDAYGPENDWWLSRKTLQPVFTARNVDAVTDRMAEIINETVDDLGKPAKLGQPIHILSEMANIINRAVLRVFFGGKISEEEAARLCTAFDTVATAIAFRFLLPFVPDVVPLPGDRTVRDNIKVIDELMYGLVHKYRKDPGEGLDIFTVLCKARKADGGEVTDKWVRDNLIAMFATGTETTVGAMAWLWPLLESHPHVNERLTAEIERVVGGERVRRSHLQHLPYTKQVVQELLRIYPVAWLFPRVAVRAGNLGGVAIKAGQTLLLSPFLTHRLESVWERPLQFDPDRFTPERAKRYHRYAYYPFGGGPHQCLGMHLFHVEAQLIIASILSRFRPQVALTGPIVPKIGATLRPKEEFEMTLVPVGGSS